MLRTLYNRFSRELEIRVNRLKAKGVPDQLAQTIAAQQMSSTKPSAENKLRNGDFLYSDDAYNNDPPVAGNEQLEAAFWYTHAAPSAGQQLKKDSTRLNPDSDLNTVNALMDAAHTKYSTAPNLSDPDYDKTNGYLRLGTTNTIDQPLTKNYATPGKVLHFSCIVEAAPDVDVADSCCLYGGIWDNTAGQRNWLEGDAFTLAANVSGAPAATVSSDYKVIALTDWGDKLESNVVTVNRPTDASFTGQIYTALSWQRLVGVIRYDIYRKTGATYELLEQIRSGATTYQDHGQVLEAVGGYPSTVGQHPIAYVQTRAGGFKPVNGTWVEYYLAIPIPATYNYSLTTDEQWFRCGLTEAPTGAGAARGVRLDRFCLSPKVGAYADAVEDAQAKQKFSVAMTSSNQGAVGDGGNYGDVDPGTGGHRGGFFGL